jgi:two-component system cell cycle sensor histidine kinase/response regulator CckA
MRHAAKFENETHELRMRHVLLIDDDQQALELYKEMLQTNDCLVSTFTSGVEALKKVMEADVEAIFCDLMMPTMAGDMFYKAVQRVKPHLCARFVFITGYEGHPRFEEFIKKEKPVVLYKPVTMGKLIGTLNLVCKRAAPPKPTHF